MTRPMSEEREKALEYARRMIAVEEAANAVGKTSFASDGALSVARALLSTTSAERGMREVYRKIKARYDAAPDFDPFLVDLMEDIRAALDKATKA